MSWFSVKEINKEIKKIRWPKKSELFKDSVTSIIFMTLFALFFIAADFIVSFVLRLIGVIS